MDGPQGALVLTFSSAASTPAGAPEVSALLSATATATEARIEASWAPEPGAAAEWIVLDGAGGQFTWRNADEEVALGYFPVPVGEIRQIRVYLTELALTDDAGPAASLTSNPQLPSHRQSGWKWEPLDGVPIQVGADERVGVRALFRWDDHLSHNRGIGFQLRPTLELERWEAVPHEAAPGVFVDQLTLHLAPGTTRAQVEAMNVQIGRGASVVYAPTLTDVWRVRLPVDVEPTVAADWYRARPEVRSVWPAVNYAPDEIPADGQGEGYELAGVARAWERGRIGDRAVRVAIIDATGFSLDHPDLAHNLALNPGEIPPSVLGEGCEPCFVDADGDGVLGFADLNDPANWAGPGEPCDPTVDLVCDLNGDGLIESGDLFLHLGWATSEDSWYNGVDDDDFDGDPSTFVDDLVGWDFSTNGGTARPSVSATHGTHVQSLLSGLHATESGPLGDGGIAGVAGRVSVLPLKANALTGGATDEPTTIGMPDQRFLEAVAYVEALNADDEPQNDVDVVVVSMGWSFKAIGVGCQTIQYSKLLHQTNLDAPTLGRERDRLLDDLPNTTFAQAFVERRSPLYVLSAGNEGLDLSDGSAFHVPSDTFKAAFETQTLVVGGFSAHLLEPHRPVDYAVAVGSNYGDASVVDIYAPWGPWRVLRSDGVVESASGTSLAAPVVGGSAALVAAELPAFDGAALRDRLLSAGAVTDAPPNPCGGGPALWTTSFLFASGAVP